MNVMYHTASSHLLGADRVTLAFLCDAYDEEELEGGDVSYSSYASTLL